MQVAGLARDGQGCGGRDRWQQENLPNIAIALGADGSWSVLLDASVNDGLLTLLQPRPNSSRHAVRAGRSRLPTPVSTAAGLGAVPERPGVCNGRSVHELWEPDLVVTADEAFLRIDADRSWQKLTDQAAFVTQLTPHIERANKVKALRDRWDREAKAKRTGPR